MGCYWHVQDLSIKCRGPFDDGRFRDSAEAVELTCDPQWSATRNSSSSSSRPTTAASAPSAKRAGWQVPVRDLALDDDQRATAETVRAHAGVATPVLSADAPPSSQRPPRSRTRRRRRAISQKAAPRRLASLPGSWRMRWDCCELPREAP